ncbi:MAG TPA: nitrite reductase [Marmoricola sp.]|jgi:precorrin-3B synthase|nr:nitrite reductase [Marmoricola sp.]
MLVRLRLIGGRVGASGLRSLAEVAEQLGDGRVHVTSRANLQLRALPGAGQDLDPEAVAALEQTGLLPSRTHELVRNVMTSPQTGVAGGRADLRPVADQVDALLCADPALAALPGRFLFVLDDGRGDLVGHPCDLGLVALDESTAQLRVGGGWGDVLPLAAAARLLIELARAFVDQRGQGPAAPWHVEELDEPLVAPVAQDGRVPSARPALPYGEVPGGRHVEVPAAGLDRVDVRALTRTAREVVVTPWRGVLIPGSADD